MNIQIKERMLKTIKKTGTLLSGSVFAMLIALALPLQAQAQDYYDSVDESETIGNNDLGAGLDIFAEFEHSPGLVRAYGSLDAYATIFGSDIDVLHVHVLSQVEDGESTNEAQVDLFNIEAWSCDEPVQWGWESSVSQDIGPSINVNFPILMGLSINLSCDMDAEVYGNIMIGAALPGAGLDGAVGSRVSVNVAAGLEVNVGVLKVRVNLEASFVLFDYSINIAGTISPCGVNVVIYTDFQPISIEVYLVVKTKTLWGNWKTLGEVAIWSWSLVHVITEIMVWSDCWCPSDDDSDDVRPDADIDLEPVNPGRPFDRAIPIRK